MCLVLLSHHPHRTFLSIPSPHPPHRLHPFPTRRSSALPCSFAESRKNPQSDADNSPNLTPFLRHARCQSTLATRVPQRSEEHTSELHSRPHIACRLLLGKKKCGTSLT